MRKIKVCHSRERPAIRQQTPSQASLRHLQKSPCFLRLCKPQPSSGLLLASAQPLSSHPLFIPNSITTSVSSLYRMVPSASPNARTE